MRRRQERDASTAQAVMTAIALIEDRTPSNEGLRKRARRGSLKLNFNSVEIESGVKRHLFDSPGCVYDAEHRIIVEKMPKKDTAEAVPLRKQLDQVRIEKEEAVTKLALARTYAFKLLERMRALELEVKRLTELLECPDDDADEDIIGTGKVVGLPVPDRKTVGGRRRKAA